jgi:acyl-coenzyme A thioesterase PaaI-like protein
MSDAESPVVAGGRADSLAEVLRRLEENSPPAGYAAMIDALRSLLDDVTGARPTAGLVATATARFEDLAREFGACRVGEDNQLSGRIGDVPGRGQVLLPPIVVTEQTTERITGQLTFGRFYLGGNSAAHGGAISLAFDELMGRLANAGREPSRTAYLQVSFRSITPMEQPLTIEVRTASVDGRKSILRGEIRDGERICAEAEALFVALLPGQP